MFFYWKALADKRSRFVWILLCYCLMWLSMLVSRLSSLMIVGWLLASDLSLLMSFAWCHCQKPFLFRMSCNSFDDVISSATTVSYRFLSFSNIGLTQGGVYKNSYLPNCDLLLFDSIQGELDLYATFQMPPQNVQTCGLRFRLVTRKTWDMIRL